MLLITFLSAGTAASQNTAFGSGALAHPSNSNLQDSAFGFEALNAPTSGNGNTACGWAALMSNTTGNQSTATGAAALESNTTGSLNTAIGVNTLLFNTTGGANTATGWNALRQNTSSANTADGLAALESNSTGANNTAVGYWALLVNTKGGSNIGLGYKAGSNLTTGSNNIDIGNAGVAAEAAKIRIGTQGVQKGTFIAGISGVAVTGAAPVEVTSAGQLGIVMSSARYKHDIRDLGDGSSNLLKLRPVSFRYNNDPSNTLQYGLVAEEVAKVYPELVVYGPGGKVETVRYSMLSAMLLNELQKQSRENQRQAGQIQQITERSARAAEQIQHLIEQGEQQAVYNRRLSAQLGQLKGMFEQAMAAQRGTRSLAAAFNK